MSGKEHFVIGTSVSAVIGVCLIANKEMNNVVDLSALIVSSSVGSVIPDIDTHSSIASKLFNKLLFILLAIMILYINIPLFADMVNINLNPSFILFFLVTVISKATGHRSFTHKWYGVVIYCYSVFLFDNMYVFLGFTIGYVLHILCDMVPKKQKRKRK